MRRYMISATIATMLAAIISPFLFNNRAYANVFDPGTIISDSIFTNSTAMSADDIQRFIVAKGADCIDGTAPCLKNYRENGKSAGTIIAEIAQRYAINPQVLLVTLQKEVGLLTMNQPGSWRYRTAMGYGCPDSTPGVCNSEYYGFTNQIRWAATMFRAIMNDSPTWYTPYHIGINSILWHPNSACGRSDVNITNRATVALYSYTPYRPNAAALAAGFGTGDSCSSYGNRNFWLYFNTWFGSSTSSILIQSPQNQAVYLQSGNIKYFIPNWNVIDAYGFGRFGVTPVSDAYMNSLHDGGTLSTVFSNKAKPGPIYLADNGYRFGFASEQQCIDWGFPRCGDPSYAKALEPSVFDRMYEYGALSPLMLNGSSVHLMQNGRKRTFLSGKSRTERGYGVIPHTPITNPMNTTQPYAESLPQNNSFVSFKNTPTIYYYSNNTFYRLSYDAFRSLSSTTPTFVDTFSVYTKTPPTSQILIKDTVQLSDGSLYHFVDGKKVNVTNVRHHWPAGQTLDALQPILQNRKDDFVATNNSTYRTPAGTITSIENKHHRDFYSLTDYFALGHTTPIPVNATLINSLAKGPFVIAPGHGSLYQSNDPAKQSLIYTTSTDGSTCQLSSLNQLGEYRLRTSPVQRLSVTGNTTTLSSATYDETGSLHLVGSNYHVVVPATDLATTWGIKQKISGCTFRRSFLSQIPLAGTFRFARSATTGVIYTGNNGQKHPIFSYNAFLRMGGSSINTIDIPDSLLVAMPNGSAITQ